MRLALSTSAILALGLAGLGETACMPASSVSSDSVDDADTGSLAVSPPPEPVWDAGEAVVVLSELESRGFPDPVAMEQSFRDTFSEGDDFCPGTETLLGTPAMQGCVADSGWYYLGIGGSVDEMGEDEEGWFHLIYQFGDMVIEGTEGQRLSVGGHWSHAVRSVDDTLSWTVSLTGSWRHEQSEAPWLSSGLSAWLDIEGEGTLGEERLDWGTATTTLNGGLAVDVARVYFEDLRFGVDGCGDEASGAIRMADPSGYWWRLDFGDTCDLCGELSFNGEVVPESGDVCASLKGLGWQLLEILPR